MGIIVPIPLGGTGASTAANARTNLSLYSKAEVDALINGVITSSSPQGRLTCIPGVSVPDAEASGVDKVYYVPHAGTLVPRFSGVIWQHKSIGNGLSLTLDADTGHTNPHAAGDIFDFFVFTLAGVETLGTGPRWINGATELGGPNKRGQGTGSTELELFNGVIVNKNAINLRYGPNSGDIITVAIRQATYVGSFSPISNGMAADSEANRLLFNAHHRLQRPMVRRDPRATWLYSSATPQIANADIANKLRMLIGLPGIWVNVRLQAYATCTSSTAPGLPVRLEIGDGSTTGIAGGSIGWEQVTTVGRTFVAGFSGKLMGLKELWWVESAPNPSGHTFTWYGASANPETFSGFTANFEA